MGNLIIKRTPTEGVTVVDAITGERLHISVENIYKDKKQGKDVAELHIWAPNRFRICRDEIRNTPDAELRMTCDQKPQLRTNWREW